jgi:hypothetical protein
VGNLFELVKAESLVSTSPLTSRSEPTQNCFWVKVGGAFHLFRWILFFESKSSRKSPTLKSSTLIVLVSCPNSNGFIFSTLTFA